MAAIQMVGDKTLRSVHIVNPDYRLLRSYQQVIPSRMKTESLHLRGFLKFERNIFFASRIPLFWG